ncbi:MAG: hypothetical protein HFP77_00325, partial [Methylococcales symbiont of Iophon sp. n. MRB-2018]
DCSRQSYCISTILGGQQRLFQTILLHFHHPWRSAEIVPDNLTAFPPSLAVSRDCSRQSYCISTRDGGNAELIKNQGVLSLSSFVFRLSSFVFRLSSFVFRLE